MTARSPISTNPSHILIARNSRGLHNPSAALSSPTETHAAASGIFRSSGSPPWYLEECETDDIASDLSTEDDEEAIELDETFSKNARLPGNVKIIVESTTFWFVTPPGTFVCESEWGAYPYRVLMQGPQRSLVLRFTFLRSSIKRELVRNWTTPIHILCHYHLPAPLRPRTEPRPPHRDDIRPRHRRGY